MLDVIKDVNTPVFELPTLCPLEIRLSPNSMKRRDPIAKENGVNVESDFIYNAGFEKRRCKNAASHEANILSLSFLQRLN